VTTIAHIGSLEAPQKVILTRHLPHKESYILFSPYLHIHESQTVTGGSILASASPEGGGLSQCRRPCVAQSTGLDKTH